MTAYFIKQAKAFTTPTNKKRKNHVSITSWLHSSCKSACWIRET